MNIMQELFNGFYKWSDRKYQSWIDRRSPISKTIKLTQKRIYIIPNKTGLLFVALTTLMFVNGVNYQNNLIFSFSVLLLSIFITSIVVTYQNMAGLIITAGHGDAVFLGKSTTLHLFIEHRAKKSKEGIRLGFDRSSSIALQRLDSRQQVTLSFKTQKRGRLLVPKISPFSVYPVGLFTCWSWVNLDFDGVVYPTPVYSPFQYVGQSDQGDEQVQNLISSGIDDFRGFKKYQTGDSLKHVAWRQFAKTNQLLTKEFEQPQAQGHWLDWDALPGLGQEQRLQVLCGWVVRSHEENREYGLSIPGVEISSGRGDQHQEDCLTALALFGERQNVEPNGQQEQAKTQSSKQGKR